MFLWRKKPDGKERRTISSGQKSLSRLSSFSRWYSVTFAGINVLTHIGHNHPRYLNRLESRKFKIKKHSRIEERQLSVSNQCFPLPKANPCSSPSPFTLYSSFCRRQTLHPSLHRAMDTGKKRFGLRTIASGYLDDFWLFGGIKPAYDGV